MGVSIVLGVILQHWQVPLPFRYPSPLSPVSIISILRIDVEIVEAALLHRAGRLLTEARSNSPASPEYIRAITVILYNVRQRKSPLLIRCRLLRSAYRVKQMGSRCGEPGGWFVVTGVLYQHVPVNLTGTDTARASTRSCVRHYIDLILHPPTWLSSRKSTHW